jgi:hypothetical protein
MEHPAWVHHRFKSLKHLVTLAEAEFSGRSAFRTSGPLQYKDRSAHFTVVEYPLDPRMRYDSSVKRICIFPFVQHVSNGFVICPRNFRKITDVAPLPIPEPYFSGARDVTEHNKGGPNFRLW